MPILDDSEFRPDHEIEFEQPIIGSREYANEEQGVYVYGFDRETVKARVEDGIYAHKINVEISQRPGGGSAQSQLADLYFHPEDLERLGVLLQYEARKYMQLRDEAIAAKLKKEQHVQQLRENL